MAEPRPLAELALKRPVLAEVAAQLVLAVQVEAANLC